MIFKTGSKTTDAVSLKCLFLWDSVQIKASIFIWSWGEGGFVENKSKGFNSFKNVEQNLLIYTKKFYSLKTTNSYTVIIHAILACIWNSRSD